MDVVLLKLDGYDFTPWIKSDGYEWSDEDLDTDDSGRVKSGTMRRTKIDDKDNMTYTREDMPESVVRQLYLILKKKFFTTEYHNVYGDAAGTFYCSKRPGKISMLQKEGEIVWSGVSFSIHQQ